MNPSKWVVKSPGSCGLVPTWQVALVEIKRGGPGGVYPYSAWYPASGNVFPYV